MRHEILSVSYSRPDFDMNEIMTPAVCSLNKTITICSEQAMSGVGCSQMAYHLLEAQSIQHQSLQGT